VLLTVITLPLITTHNGDGKFQNYANLGVSSNNVLWLCWFVYLITPYQIHRLHSTKLQDDCKEYQSKNYELIHDAAMEVYLRAKIK